MDWNLVPYYTGWTSHRVQALFLISDHTSRPELTPHVIIEASRGTGSIARIADIPYEVNKQISDPRKTRRRKYHYSPEYKKPSLPHLDPLHDGNRDAENDRPWLIFGRLSMDFCELWSCAGTGRRNNSSIEMYGDIVVPRVLTGARSRIWSCARNCRACVCATVQIRDLPLCRPYVPSYFAEQQKYRNLPGFIWGPKREISMSFWSFHSANLSQDSR